MQPAVTTISRWLPTHTFSLPGFSIYNSVMRMEKIPTLVQLYLLPFPYEGSTRLQNWTVWRPCHITERMLPWILTEIPRFNVSCSFWPWLCIDTLMTDTVPSKTLYIDEPVATIQEETRDMHLHWYATKNLRNKPWSNVATIVSLTLAITNAGGHSNAAINTQHWQLRP